MLVETTLPQVLRWTARVIGLVFVAFCMLHVISEGFPVIDDLSPGKWGLWLGFASCLVGFGLIWKWELIGGIVSLVGITLFYGMNYAFSGKIPGGWILPMFILPGVLALTCWLAEHWKKPRSSN